ncbi:hypothetical protein CYMTET_26127 [Cymbomonas tetramitiformis]|uniref:TRAF3-interacting protein 1 n=1 Tax=Cymbomonas tetramitiformis TaxID=36881 RepID=A0AAE0FTZ2_9CHLO|nr:hypothetical protein CYMTET_26127 [Cymbomonas tetramitiformis]
MGDNYWEATQAILQGDNPLVKKPKLTENLLKKPPFRFLHDVISELQRNTGFAPGLYQEDEQDSAAIKDKERKVAYLAKMIETVGIASSEHVPARPLKVVAGLEPELTNKFLQMLGGIATQTDGAEAVKAVLAGEQQPAAGAAPASKPAPKAEPPAQEAPPPAQPEPEALPPANIPMNEPEPADSEEPPPPKPDKPPKAEKPSSRSGSRKSKSSSEEAPPPAPAPAQEEEPERQELPVRAPSRGMPERPQSARKPPPKVQNKEVAAAAAVKAAKGPPGMSTGKPPPAPSGQRAIMGEGEEDDDDETEVVIQQAEGNSEAVFGDQQGKLVRDIVQTKEALETKGEEEAEDDKEQGIILGRGRKKDGNKKEEVQKLREAVQLLCQSTNPLAKGMDQLQEDIENMNKELSYWSEERRKYGTRLTEEQRITEEELSRIGNIPELDEEMKSMHDKVNSVKAQILRNDDTIERLLSMVVQGSGK